MPPAPTGRRSLLRGAAGALLLPGSAARAEARPPARPVPLDLPEGARLTSLGALRLEEAVTGFHGLSGLHLAEDGRITAISDLARWLTGRVTWRDGKAAGIAGLRTGPLRDGAGQPLARGYPGDAEALARLADGTWLVGFERWHRIRAYAALDGPGRYVEVPRGIERAPGNGGLETLAALADRRWLLLAEQLAAPGPPGLRRGWIGMPGQWLPIAYRPGPGLDPVDAAPLADGGALVLERGFSFLGGFSGRLVRLSRSALSGAQAGQVLEGEEMLRIVPPLPVDNYEAVSVARIDGRDVVVLGSDDNENPLQATWLLFLAIAEGE